MHAASQRISDRRLRIHHTKEERNYYYTAIAALKKQVSGCQKRQKVSGTRSKLWKHALLATQQTDSYLTFRELPTLSTSPTPCFLPPATPPSRPPPPEIQMWPRQKPESVGLCSEQTKRFDHTKMINFEMWKRRKFEMQLIRSHLWIQLMRVAIFIIEESENSCESSFRQVFEKFCSRRTR